MYKLFLLPLLIISSLFSLAFASDESKVDCDYKMLTIKGDARGTSYKIEGNVYGNENEGFLYDNYNFLVKHGATIYLGREKGKYIKDEFVMPGTDIEIFCRDDENYKYQCMFIQSAANDESKVACEYKSLILSNSLSSENLSYKIDGEVYGGVKKTGTVHHKTSYFQMQPAQVFVKPDATVALTLGGDPAEVTLQFKMPETDKKVTCLRDKESVRLCKES